ncbi:ribosome recycling factor [Candidatus Saccharibacteria bacterium]|nr:ribosome recycling factor [Candidatus Saccharibacteria bacterium]
MNPNEVLNQLKTKLKAVREHFDEEIKKLRTGRAHPNMVENIMAEAYGTPMPLLQLATITTPEPQLIQISPFDPSNIQAIAQAIRTNESLGFNPVDDGRVVRIQIPPLTEERRLQIVKQLGEKQEEAFIGMRKARHDAIDLVDKAKKDKQIGEDDAKRIEKDIEEEINSCKTDIESASKLKEQEILKV